MPGLTAECCIKCSGESRSRENTWDERPNVMALFCVRTYGFFLNGRAEPGRGSFSVALFLGSIYYFSWLTHVLSRSDLQLPSLHVISSVRISRYSPEISTLDCVNLYFSRNLTSCGHLLSWRSLNIEGKMMQKINFNDRYPKNLASPFQEIHHHQASSRGINTVLDLPPYPCLLSPPHSHLANLDRLYVVGNPAAFSFCC